MPVPRLIVTAALLLVTLGGPAPAAEAALHPPRACLNKAEQRAAVHERKAIPLAEAIKLLRAHGKRAEVVGARLCRHDERLVYVLTLLAHNGKVIRTSVDAANGTLLVNTR
jgi:uncharacterized membrane protein YkoI